MATGEKKKRLVAVSPEVGRAVLELDRQMLHAWRMSFIHPVTGARMTLEAPIPADMTGLIGPIQGNIEEYRECLGCHSPLFLLDKKETDMLYRKNAKNRRTNFQSWASDVCASL